MKESKITEVSFKFSMNDCQKETKGRGMNSELSTVDEIT